jgi:hypothetical protein
VSGGAGGWTRGMGVRPKAVNWIHEFIFLFLLLSSVPRISDK